MPVDRRRLCQAITHAQGHGIAFTPAQQRARQTAIDGQRGAYVAGDIDRGLADKQLKLVTCQYTRLAWAGQGPHGRAPQPCPAQQADRCQAFDEGSSRSVGVHADSIPVN